MREGVLTPTSSTDALAHPLRARALPIATAGDATTFMQ